MTQKIGLRELRQNASEIVREVEAGETFDVTVSGRLAARLIPALRSRSHRSEEIADLWDGETDRTFFNDVDQSAGRGAVDSGTLTAMKAVMDTSVIVAGDAPSLGEDDLFVTAITFAELHAAVLTASNDADRARRLGRLTKLASFYDPLPIDAGVAIAYGRIRALVAPRNDSRQDRPMDLLIAATALANGCRLYTRRTGAFDGLDGVLEVVGV